MRRTRTKLLLLAGSAAAAVLLAELALGVDAIVSPSFAYRLAREQSRLLPDARLGHRPHPLYIDHDARGYRNARVPDLPPCLVALGDSQTYGHHVERDEAWPQVLAGAAAISTYNMAFGGWGPGQALALLDEALEMRPRIVAYGLYTGNDLYDAYDAAYRLGTLDHLATPDAGLRARMARLPPPGFARFLPHRPPSKERRGAVRAWLGRHSSLYGLLRAAKRAHLERERAASDPFTAVTWSQVRAATSDPQRFFPFDRPPVRTVFTPAWRTVALDRSDPRIREGYRLLVAALAEMNQRVRVESARFVVVIIPTKETVYRPWVPQGEEARYDHLTRVENEMLDDLHRDLAARGIAMVDGLPALRAAIAEGEAPYPISADGQKNAIGHRRLARTVAFALRNHHHRAIAQCQGGDAGLNAVAKER